VVRSIASRLVVAFVVTTVSLVAIAGLALFGVAPQFRTVGAVQEHHLQELSIFDDIRLQLNDAVHQDQNYVRTGAPAFDDAFEADIEEIARLVRVHASLHLQTVLTPDEASGIFRLRRAVDQYTAVQDEVDELLTAGRRAEALAVSSGRGRRAAETALSTIRDLVALERHEANEQIAGAATQADRVYRFMLIAALAAVVVTGGAVWSVVRSVTTPVGRLVDATRRIDAGNLSIRTGIGGKDEIGALARSFDRMVDRLEGTFREQERFLTDVSHELRTPITIIRGHLEVLTRGSRTPDQVARAVAVSLDELERMGRLVHDLLLLARAIRPDFLAPERIALRPFLMEVFDKAVGIAPRLWHLGPLADVVVLGDRDQLTQAILNLLRNAADHTGPTDAIQLSSRLADGTVQITVTDAGEGIDPADLPHLFTRFHRGSTSKAFGGTGLGLSIVKAIAIAHGGDVRVEGREGTGTLFAVILPVAAPPEVHQEEPRHATLV
jgi:signal transduction histidine kinase